MPTVKFHHVAYQVLDLDRSIEFYNLLLKEEPVHRGMLDHPVASTLLGHPGTVLEVALWNLGADLSLELIKFHSPKPSAGLPAEVLGGSHLGLICEDIRAEFARLKAAGVMFRTDDVVEIPEELGRGISIFAIDPDGNFIEFVQAP